MATMRELKGRINSVHSSQKITGAMKMISSARLRMEFMDCRPSLIAGSYGKYMPILKNPVVSFSRH